MTEEKIETPVIENPQIGKDPTRMRVTLRPQSDGYSGSGNSFVRALLRPRSMNLLSGLAALVVLAICGVLLYTGYKGLRDEQARQVLREANAARIEGIRAQYQANIRLWDKEVDDYNSCLRSAVQRVDSRNDVRGTFFSFADGIEATLTQLFPDSPKAQEFGKAFAANQHQYIEQHFVAFDLVELQASCTSPPLEPVIPSELAGQG